MALIRIENREEWERVRERGHRYWIVKKGLLTFALPFIVFQLVFFYLADVFFLAGNHGPWWAVIVFVILTSLGAGYLLSDRVWHRAEDRFDSGSKKPKPR